MHSCMNTPGGLLYPESFYGSFQPKAFYFGSLRTKVVRRLLMNTSLKNAFLHEIGYFKIPLDNDFDDKNRGLVKKEKIPKPIS